jgi:epoxyqueuosine reductase
MNLRHSNNELPSEKKQFSRSIKAKAFSLGFSAIGIAQAEAVDEETSTHFRRWLADGNHADMHYMSDYLDKRLDPRLLMEGTKSIISVALNYFPSRLLPQDHYQLALYAYGKDYHDIVKMKLHQLASEMGLTNYRAFCDTAPILERYWAVKAGLGWTGRNHQLIIPHAGSSFFLGEIFTDLELEYDHPVASHCGNCHRCIDTCPTGALQDGMEIDANRCLSYLTIEHRGEIPVEFHSLITHCIYGCDHCQQVCPWNRFASPTQEPQLQISEDLMNMTCEQWAHLTPDDYRRIFKGSAVKRAKYEGLMRNIRIAERN